MFRTWRLPVVVVLAGCGPAFSWPSVSSVVAAELPGHSSPTDKSSNDSLVVSGKTLPAPGRISEIAARHDILVIEDAFGRGCYRCSRIFRCIDLQDNWNYFRIILIDSIMYKYV